ncbi:MmcB family DNA repair protein, partial [Acinetobacter baumannii]
MSDFPLSAAQVVRGAVRMLLRHDLVALAEVPLDGNRRADLMAIDARGHLVIVEVKVSRADLLGDAKWTDYLGCCDRFYWA